jgi:hypothetical protein
MKKRMAVFGLVFLGYAFSVSAAAPMVPVGGKPWYEGDSDSVIRDEGPIAGVFTAIGCYPVNRIGDFLDVMQIQFGFGFGVHVNAHATRALQLGVGGSSVSRCGFDGRKGGLSTETKGEFSLLPFTAEGFTRHGAVGGLDDYRLPEDVPLLYRLHRNYTGLGAEATLAVVNVGAEARPAEALDFVFGVFGMDLFSDDYPRAWDGNSRPSMDEEEAAKIKRVVIVPSRVVADKRIRMGTGDGIGVYYSRQEGEKHWGLLGTWGGSGTDQRAASEFSKRLTKNQFSIHRELLERMARITMTGCKWDTVATEPMLKAFEEHAMIKHYRSEKVKRLPNYAKLAAYYGADAILDVRVWEYGVWHQTVADNGVMRLDCEVKLIAQPSNKVLFNARVLHCPDSKEGLTLLEFAKTGKNADNLSDETRQACDVVMTHFKDLLLERH